MKSVTIYLRKSADRNNPSINDVRQAVDCNGVSHTNQYLKPEGGLYSYEEYVNMLVIRFGYDVVQISQGWNERPTRLWASKEVIKSEMSHECDQFDPYLSRY